MELETKYSRDVILSCFLWLQVAISHQEQVRESGAKISTINIYGRLRKRTFAFALNYLFA
ncbi:hypothetical protein Hanom_Chr01g00059441 [Helianthus anomalus]